MYALVLIRYRVPIEKVAAVTDEHRAYLRGLQAQGTVLAAGPFDPRNGGALLVRVPDDDANAALDKVRDGDPFWRNGIASYELINWKVGLGKDQLDRL